jgi:transposase
VNIGSTQIPANETEKEAFIASLLEQKARLETDIEELRSRNQYKKVKIEKLSFEIAVLRRARFGQSSERFALPQLDMLDAVHQQPQDLDDAEVGVPTRQTIPGAPASLSVKPARRAFPEDLPREVIEHAPDCRCPECEGTAFTVIGTDVREVLDYTPGTFKVIVHRRPKLSCRACETVRQAKMPELPIYKGIAGPGLVAQIITAKYCDHIPLDRQQKIYRREGVDISKSTMADIVGRVAELLSPLQDLIGEHVRAGHVIHADDTPVKVLEPGLGKTRTGRFWVAVRDGRPWGSDQPPGVFYQFSPDRAGIRAAELLKGCRGHLHADGYSGFNRLYEPALPGADPPLIEVACLAHARRYFEKVFKNTGSPLAQNVLERMRQLFDIEREIRGRSPSERRDLRQTHAKPIWTDLHALLERAQAQSSTTSKLAEAIQYSLKRWTALTRYLDNGHLEIDNNAAERAIKPVAISRKNWLFAGSDAGGKRAATIYTLIETARLNGIDPGVYLRAVIARIPDTPINRIAELLPWNIELADNQG